MRPQRECVLQFLEETAFAPLYFLGALNPFIGARLHRRQVSRLTTGVDYDDYIKSSDSCDNPKTERLARDCPTIAIITITCGN